MCPGPSQPTRNINAVEEQEQQNVQPCGRSRLAIQVYISTSICANKANHITIQLLLGLKILSLPTYIYADGNMYVF
jgi:hypothetical protein